MRISKLAILSVLALTPTLMAQSVPYPERSPVPTRICAETYGAPSGLPDGTELGIWLDCTGAEEAVVQVFGAAPDNFGFLLIGTEAAEIPVLGATALVLPNVAIPMARFDAEGKFSMPVPLGMRELIGVDVYLQGLQIEPAKPDAPFQMSAGLKLSWYAGNPQPALQYTGPEFTGILVEKFGPIDTPPEYEVFAKVVAPTTGYTFALEQVHKDAGVTSVYMRLTRPDEVVIPVLVAHRCSIPLGWDVGEKVEVFIAQVDPGSTCLLWELAAVIETRF